MAAVISQTSRMEWTAEHTGLRSCLTQRRKGGTVFRLAVSRRRTRIDSHVSRKEAKTQRGNGFLFSSQPEAYQDSILMSHAKETAKV
jgi:hypothetical protein